MRYFESQPEFGRHFLTIPANVQPILFLLSISPPGSVIRRKGLFTEFEIVNPRQRSIVGSVRE